MKHILMNLLGASMGAALAWDGIIRARRAQNPWLRQGYCWRRPMAVLEMFKPFGRRHALVLAWLIAMAVVVIVFCPSFAHAQLEPAVGAPADNLPAAPADPNALTMFARMTGALVEPIKGGVDVVMGGLITLTTLWALPLLTVTMALTLAMFMFALGDEFPLFRIARQFLRVGAALMALAGVATMHQWVVDPILNLSTDIGNAITNAAPGTAPIAGQAFDTLWTHAVSAGQQVSKSLPSGFSLKAIACAILIGTYYFVVAVALVVAWVEWLGSLLMLYLVISLAPLAVLAFAFAWAKPFFNGWISTCIGLIVAQSLILALLMLAMVAEEQIVNGIVNGGTVYDLTSLVTELVIIAAIFVGVCLLAGKVPGIAAGIAGSAYATVGSGALSVSAMAAGVRAAGGLVKKGFAG